MFVSALRFDGASGPTLLSLTRKFVLRRPWLRVKMFLGSLSSLYLFRCREVRELLQSERSWRCARLGAGWCGLAGDHRRGARRVAQRCHPRRHRAHHDAVDAHARPPRRLADAARLRRVAAV